MIRLALSALLLVLLLPGCGGDDGSTSTPTISADGASSDAPPASDAAPASDGAPAAESAPATDGTDAPATGNRERKGREPSELASSIKPLTDGPPLADPEKRVQLPMDTSKSKINWIVVKNGTEEVKGRFSALAGGLSIDPKDLRTTSGEIGVDLMGIDTGETARDGNVSKVFFGVGGKSPGHGQVTMTSFRPEKLSVEVGEKTRGLAQVGFYLGGTAVGAVLPVELERLDEARWRFATLETFEIGIDELEMTDRKAALMKLCEHKSIANGVKTTATVVFGAP